jgi:hypothetical protein
MNARHLFYLGLVSISLLGIAGAQEDREAQSVFDEPAASIRIPGKALPAPIDVWVEGEVTKVCANSGIFSVQGRRMTFIHAYDVPEQPPICVACDPLYGECFFDVDVPSPVPSHCDCNEIIVRNVGQTQIQPTPSSKIRDFPIGRGKTGELVMLEERDFVGRTNLHPNNQLAPIGYVDDPVNCPCDQTILTPRSGAPFGMRCAANGKEETVNASYETNGLSYDLTVPTRSLKKLKAGDHVMVGFAVTDNGNVAYTIIRQQK